MPVPGRFMNRALLGKVSDEVEQGMRHAVGEANRLFYTTLENYTQYGYVGNKASECKFQGYFRMHQGHEALHQQREPSRGTVAARTQRFQRNLRAVASILAFSDLYAVERRVPHEGARHLCRKERVQQNPDVGSLDQSRGGN